MKSLIDELSQRVRQAIADIGADGDPLVRPAQDEKFGHYQSNCALGLGKRLGKKPRDVAASLVAALAIDDLCDPPEIAGPGFVNFRFKPSFLAKTLQDIPAADSSDVDRIGIDPTNRRQVVAIDMSSPNLAKEMHIGHLRSTVIGDCIARILEFEGHEVHRENHVGDWGTQFGMLVAHLRSVRPDVANQPDDLVISDLESFYVEAKARFDADEGFKTESRQTVVALQSGDPPTRKIWKAFCNESLRHCHAIYDRLGVQMIDRGESYYADRMKEVIARLEPMRSEKNDGFVKVSDGALCLFMDGFTTRDGDPLPMIVRKSDGGFNYSTSDLATILHRVEELKTKRIIYVVGMPQKQHFEMLFAAVRQAGWVTEDVELKHIAFGSILAETGLPFKTREGGTVKLKDVLDTAVDRARKVLERADRSQGAASRSWTKGEMDATAEQVGLAAVKYYDLAHALNSDYKFDLNSMLAMEGNTAPYMMYAYARIRSIGAKAGVDLSSLPADTEIALEHPAEIALAKKVLQFRETLDTVARELKPNVLTDYLYELAKTFSRFYDRKVGVRVIDASPDSVRLSRLRICDLTARVLKLGLHLLGIETVEQM